MTHFDYTLNSMTASQFKALTKEHRMPHKHRKALNDVFFWLVGAVYWRVQGDTKNEESNVIIANAYLGIAGMSPLSGTTPAEMFQSLLARVETYPPRPSTKEGA